MACLLLQGGTDGEQPARNPVANDPLKQDDPRRHDGTRKAGALHVLVVEDDDVMREMLVEALRWEGWKVTECADAMRWLQSCVHQATSPGRAEYTAGETDCDVVICDICMPTKGSDVLQTLREIHCDEARPPMILITAFGDDETYRQARQVGDLRVLDKPFAVKDLIRQAHAVVNAHSGRRCDRAE